MPIACCPVQIICRSAHSRRARLPFRQVNDEPANPSSRLRPGRKIPGVRSRVSGKARRAAPAGGRSIAQKGGDGRLLEIRFQHGHGIIKPLMQGAQPLGMGAQSQRTMVDSLQGINGLDHVVHRELVQRPGQNIAAPQTATHSTRPDLPSDWSTLERYPAGTWDAERSPGSSPADRLATQQDHRPQCILCRLRNHRRPQRLILDL